MKEEKLFSLVVKKRSFFETILDLCEIEHTLSFRDWISNLEQKKVLIACIEEIDKEIIPFRGALYTLSQEVTEELESIRLIVERILSLENKNQEIRKRQIDEERRTLL